MTTWVDEVTARRIEWLASSSDSSTSAVIRCIVADRDLGQLETAGVGRPVTLASVFPLDLVARVDEAAISKGITRSELIAAALIAATS